MKKKILILLIIICIIFFFTYFFFIKKSGLNLYSEIKVDNQSSGKTLEYRNAVRNFTLNYPTDLTFKDNDEGDTTHTIVFSDANNEKSFQVFFTPYFGDTITQSRILKDVPSGKFTQPIEVIIGDNIHALVFFSTQDVGELREVWFLHDGYLFEVSTYKDLDTWLADIMKTWRFFQIGTGGGQ